jgi:hypothetical protein
MEVSGEVLAGPPVSLPSGTYFATATIRWGNPARASPEMRAGTVIVKRE